MKVYVVLLTSYTYRPLSRRLDRCNRMIQNESRDPFGGNVYYVTMPITFLTHKFRNSERNLHCDVVHITTEWVFSLTLGCNIWRFRDKGLLTRSAGLTMGPMEHVPGAPRPRGPPRAEHIFLRQRELVVGCTAPHGTCLS